MKTSQTFSKTPKLARPGAGLPVSQRLFLKFWLGPVVSRRTPLKSSRDAYEGLTAKLIDHATRVPLNERNTKVLVGPIPGLEDSSRYWSVNDVLEHLLIVSRKVESIILALASGSPPQGEIDIALAKPKGEITDPLEEFIGYAPELLQRIEAAASGRAPGLSSKTTFRHPWFGEFTARQWYWLLAGHQGIHYRQMKSVVRTLLNPSCGS